MRELIICIKQHFQILGSLCIIIWRSVVGGVVFGQQMDFFRSFVKIIIQKFGLEKLSFTIIYHKEN